MTTRHMKMAAVSGKHSLWWVQRFFVGILRREIGPAESRLVWWRTFTNKHFQCVTLSSKVRRLGFGSFITSSLIASRGVGFWSGSQPEAKESTMADKDPESSPDAEIIAESDRLYLAYNPTELYDYLTKYKDTNNEEVLWRLCRACRDVAQMTSTSSDIKKKRTYEALDYAKRGLEINDNNYASHKWFAICISEVGDYEGTQKKVANAYVIRDHFQKAIDLQPNDATCRHLMGLWCFTFADMPWYQRKIASAIFGTPPTSTYEEAFAHFKKGEDISPNFYSKNLMMLGKTLIRMKKKEDAIPYLTKARDYICKKDEDQQAVKEAKQLLSDIGVKS